MCRSLLTFFRGTHTVSSRKTRRLLDKSKTFHVACGVAICIFSVVHVSAHLVNVVNFSVSYSDEFPALNLARYRGEVRHKHTYTSSKNVLTLKQSSANVMFPGITGVLLVLILFLMFTSSSYCVRVSNYEIFWYTHNLFIVFYIILMVHMVGGALKYQTNIEAHPPGCLRANQSSAEQQGKELDQGEDEERRCREEAHFQPHYPQTWLWVSGPLCLYCAERFYRYIRSSHPITIVTVIRHPCDVIELRMLKKNFKARPGQYILLNCPGVSSFENHPFTLTTVRLNVTLQLTCPTENKETFGIHLRVVGDWTERFTRLLLPQPRMDLEILPMVQQRRYPKLYLWMVQFGSPSGSPSEEVFNYDVSLCVAGGIGVTPFACVLHALLDGWTGFRLQRLYFVWVCRELQSFYWFAELLCALHHKLWQENRPDYFNLKLYLSRTDNLQSMSEEKYRPLTSRLLVGRPRWKLLFDEIGKTNKHKRVGVFCCGPKGISRTLHRLCNSARTSGTTFEFNKESFS
uniref:NADPH oxidase 4 n=1 Tax=Lates calcarifer TaxID=8187 RepID=A0A4W6F7I9_LATCA